MSKFKKTKKSKDEKFVSQPLNFSHIGHLGPLDVTASTVGIDETVIEPPTPCQGTDGNIETKTFQKLLHSCDFQQTLRNIVREETIKALQDERSVLLKEIETLRHPPPPCHTPGTVDDEVGLRAANKTDRLSASMSISVGDVAEDKCLSSRFENPLYEVQHYLRKLKPNPAPRQRRVQDLQDSDGASQTELKEVNRPKFGPRTARRLSRDDERECLSQALQSNIVDLVDRLQFNYSALPDQLISSGHMTEDECKMLRNDITSRKDQVRYLVSRTKCRDLKDIQRFVELIETEVPDVVAKIRQQFDENKRNNVKCTTCALCQCSNNVDIKDIVDMLWSVRVISDGFYNEVIACSKPRGSQELLWKSLIEICNSKQTKEKRKIYDILFEFIGKKGNFDFIVKPLRGMLEKDGRLECHCHFSLKASLSDRGSYGVLSSCSPRSSWSGSRQSTFSGEFNQEIEQVEERLGRNAGLKGGKLERQASIDENRSELTTIKQRLSHAASLDKLETIQEETSKPHKKPYNKAYRKGIDYVYQTVEFHGPVLDYANVKANNLNEFCIFCLDENENISDARPNLTRLHKIGGFEQNQSSEA